MGNIKEFNVNILKAKSIEINGEDILKGTREYTKLVSDEKIILTSSDLSNELNIISQEGVEIGDVEVEINGSVDNIYLNYKKMTLENGIYKLSNTNINNLNFTFENDDINELTYRTYKDEPVQIENKIDSETGDPVYENQPVIQQSGTIYNNDIINSEVSVSFTTPHPYWKVMELQTVHEDNVFTFINDFNILSNSTFTSNTHFNKGEVVSFDKETFAKITYKDENNVYHIDNPIIMNGEIRDFNHVVDVYRVNFIKDYRDGSYDNGLKDALISDVNTIIYGKENDEIIVDAGENNYWIIGNMTTYAENTDYDKTCKFDIMVSDDGINYTLLYSNTETRTIPVLHEMSGTGRFIKIVFKEEIEGWGRIFTHHIDGKFWDLKLSQVSKLYKYNSYVKVNDELQTPLYVDYDNNMEINTVYYNKEAINTQVLKFETSNIEHLECNLWTEEKGLI